MQQSGMSGNGNKNIENNLTGNGYTNTLITRAFVNCQNSNTRQEDTTQGSILTIHYISEIKKIARN